jgi:hypothetical protein
VLSKKNLTVKAKAGGVTIQGAPWVKINPDSVLPTAEGEE